MKILGLSGSLRTGSYNLRLLRAAGVEMAPAAHLAIFGRLARIPPFNEDMAAPSSVVELRNAISTASGILIATPEYNSSVPGQLKNALDWASRPFPDNVLRNKPVAVIGASTGIFGAVWAQAELRKVLKTIGASVIEADLPVGQAKDAFDESGRLIDPDQREKLIALTGVLVEEVKSTTQRASCSC